MFVYGLGNVPFYDAQRYLIVSDTSFRFGRPGTGTIDEILCNAYYDGAVYKLIANGFASRLVFPRLGTSLIYFETYWGSAGDTITWAKVSTYIDLTGSRALGTSYQNTTAVPKFVSVTVIVAATEGGIIAQVSVDNSTFYDYDASASPTAAQKIGVSILVPAGYWYKVITQGTAPTLNKWFETPIVVG